MKDTCSVEYVKAKYQAFAVVKGFLQAIYITDEQIKEKFGEGCKGVYNVNAIYEPDFCEVITLDYYGKHQKDFDRVKNGLFNEDSKRAFEHFVKAKIEQDDSLIISDVKSPQYFFDYPCWKLGNHEVLVDGGAYDGDSIADFCNILHSKYDKIFAFEPDADNAKKLHERIITNSWSNIEVVEKGLSKQTGILRFNASGNMESSIQENGNVELEVDSIDNILDGYKPTIIKMDIEGAEMDALHGAENTIRKWEPMLYISAYHKKHDLIDIYDYVNSISGVYEWFFYVHKPLTIDAVLYAIPRYRLKM